MGTHITTEKAREISASGKFLVYDIEQLDDQNWKLSFPEGKGPEMYWRLKSILHAIKMDEEVHSRIEVKLPEEPSVNDTDLIVRGTAADVKESLKLSLLIHPTVHREFNKLHCSNKGVPSPQEIKRNPYWSVTLDRNTQKKNPFLLVTLPRTSNKP